MRTPTSTPPSTTPSPPGSSGVGTRSSPFSRSCIPATATSHGSTSSGETSSWRRGEAWSPDHRLAISRRRPADPGDERESGLHAASTGLGPDSGRERTRRGGVGVQSRSTERRLRNQLARGGRSLRCVSTTSTRSTSSSGGSTRTHPGHRVDCADTVRCTAPCAANASALTRGRRSRTAGRRGRVRSVAVTGLRGPWPLRPWALPASARTAGRGRGGADLTRATFTQLGAAAWLRDLESAEASVPA